MQNVTSVVRQAPCSSTPTSKSTLQKTCFIKNKVYFFRISEKRRQKCTVLLTLMHTSCSVFHQTDANADRSSCHIQWDPQPRYVAAFSLNYQPGRGCYSNGSSPSHQLVHVINLKLAQGSDDDVTRRTVTLRTEPRNFTASQGQ